MIPNLLLVACGGAVGAVLRYLISLLPIHSAFPVLTLLTNLLGAAAIGIVVGLADNPKTLLFLKTGVCGGFTTFSTFSLETMTLFEQRRVPLGILYAILSVLLCLLGVWLGQTVGKICKG